MTIEQLQAIAPEASAIRLEPGIYVLVWDDSWIPQSAIEELVTGLKREGIRVVVLQCQNRDAVQFYRVQP